MRRPYGIAGAGRASAHLQAYFRLLKIPYKVWDRRSGLSPGEVFASCPAVFLLLSDAAIQPFIAANPFLRAKRLIHFSGSLSLKGAYAMHPFRPLSPRELTLAEYQAIPFVLEPGVSLKKLVPEFSNPVLRVSREQKQLYHALCALGANMPVMLWQKALSGLAQFGVTREEAVRYFQASLDNFASSPDSALTGPIARGDEATVNSDISALGDGPYAKIYSAFAKAYTPFQERSHDRNAKRALEHRSLARYSPAARRKRQVRRRFCLSVPAPAPGVAKDIS